MVTCKACKQRISKYLLHDEIVDTVYVEGFPLGMWGRYDPPGFLCATHSALDRDNRDARKAGALNTVLPADRKLR